MSDALFEYLIRLGDDRLVLGHRLSEWCGHGPILEEDIALANISLDLIGQAALLLKLAGEVEGGGTGRDADALAYFRDAIDYRNAQIVELPNGCICWNGSYWRPGSQRSTSCIMRNGSHSLRAGACVLSLRRMMAMPLPSS